MDDTDRDREAIAACSGLIRENLHQILELGNSTPLTSFDETWPCIEKEALYHLGIVASDSVLEVMQRLPHMRLVQLLKRHQEIAQTGVVICGVRHPDKIPDELIHLLADMLGSAYWVARSCTGPDEFFAIENPLHSKIGEWYDQHLSTPESAEPQVTQRITEEQLMAIDVSKYDNLVTYPAKQNWPTERKKILFLQAAVEIGIDRAEVVDKTVPFFGQMLAEPFRPLVFPDEVEPFVPPPFDIARQTPGVWAALADQAWSEHRDEERRRISQRRDSLLKQGILKEFNRPRKHSGVAGKKKAPIIDEKGGFQWAAAAYFSPTTGWTALVRKYSSFEPGTPEATEPTRKQVDQIRKRVIKVLRDVGLPLPAWK